MGAPRQEGVASVTQCGGCARGRARLPRRRGGRWLVRGWSVGRVSVGNSPRVPPYAFENEAESGCGAGYGAGVWVRAARAWRASACVTRQFFGSLALYCIERAQTNGAQKVKLSGGGHPLSGSAPRVTNDTYDYVQDVWSIKVLRQTQVVLAAHRSMQHLKQQPKFLGQYLALGP